MKWSLKRDELLMLSGGVLAGVAIAVLALSEGPLGWGVWSGVLVFAVLIAVTAALGLPSSSGIISIAHMVIVSGFLALGLVPGLIASAGGAVLADIIRTVLARPLGYEPRTLRRGLFAMAGNVGVQTCGLLAGASGFRLLGGSAPLLDLGVTDILPLLTLFVIYFIINSLGLAAFLWARRRPLLRRGWADWWHVVVLELVPLPLSIPIASIYNGLGIGIFLLSSVALLGSALAIRQAGHAGTRLQRRVRELSTLNAVSQALSNLDLLELLSVIHTQVARLMPGDNFYIALCDSDREFLDFAFVVENGARVFRPARPFSNGLAEYVIHHRVPLLIRSNVAKVAKRLGIEPIGIEAQSWLGVPMIAENRVLGVIGIQSYEQANVYDERHVEILSTIAAQAAMAVRNAQFYGQARQRAAELAMLNTISTAVSSTLDLDHVLELIVSSVMSLMGSQKSAIFLLDETRGALSLAASKGLSEEYVHASEELLLSEGRATVAQEKKPLLIADIHSDPRFACFRELAIHEGFRAFADVPLIEEDDVIGALTTYFSDVHRFNLAEVDLLTTFANQAAAAVANARLYARTQRALVRHVEELSALEAISRELSIALDLDQVINLVLDCAMQVTGATSGAIVMIDPEEGRGRVVSHRGFAPSLVESGGGSQWAVDKGLVGRAVSTQQPVLVEDVGRDPDYVPTLSVESEDQRAVCSQLAVPIVRKGEVLGVINLESTRLGAFDSQHAAFVRRLATQAAIALQNAQLFKQVAEGRDRLQAVLNSTREGILMLDVNGRVVLVNPMIEELWGMSQTELAGANLRDLLRGPDRRLAARLGYSRAEISRLLAQLPTGPTELGKDTYVLDAPRHRVIERMGAPVLDESGHVWGWMLVLRDVTEEKELERVREDVTRMIVHDLRSPLAAILGSLELIENVTEEQPQNRLLVQALDIAARSTQRLRDMVDSLLDISRLEAGQTKLNQQPHTLAALVHSAISLVSPLAEEAGLRLKVEVPDDLPPVEVDEELIERVLINLLDNAVKFTPLGGRVTISVLPEDRAFVRCSVHDTGPGIPRDYLDRIFERFVQVPGQDRRRQGTGLGLAFCRLAVEAHGGRIWVESVEGRGSHFHFTLPVARCEAEG